MTIKLFEHQRAIFYAPFYAAHVRGVYQAAGVEVEMVTSPDPAVTAIGLHDGTADVAWGGPMRVLLAFDSNPECDLVLFAEAVTRDPFFLIGRVPKPNFQLADLLGIRLASVSEVPTPWLCLQEDLRRAGLGVRDLVTGLEQSVVDLAAEYDIDAASRRDAPGVYVDGVKLASIGLRIRRGSSFHGMALNVDTDLEPFSRINPCGFKGLEVTSLARLGAESNLNAVRDRLLPHLLAHLKMD